MAVRSELEVDERPGRTCCRACQTACLRVFPRATPGELPAGKLQNACSGRSSVRPVGWKAETEATALARSGPDVDGPVMRLGDGLDDREPEPGTFVRVEPLARNLVEAAEDLRLLVGRDPGTGVLHGERRITRARGEGHLDGAALVGDAHGIVEEVEERLHDQWLAAAHLDARNGSAPQLHGLLE